MGGAPNKCPSENLVFDDIISRKYSEPIKTSKHKLENEKLKLEVKKLKLEIELLEYDKKQKDKKSAYDKYVSDPFGNDY